MAIKSMTGRKKVLFLSNWYPIPTNNGSKLRIFNLLRGLSTVYDVTLISFYESHEAGYSISNSEIESICTDLITIPIKRFHPKSTKARIGFLSPTPRMLMDTYSPQMAQQIETTVSQQKPILVIASQLGTASYRDHFKMLPAIFEEFEIGLYYDRYKNSVSSIHRLRNYLTLIKHRHYLEKLLNRYQACTVVSDRERQLLPRLDSTITTLEVIPNCINTKNYNELVKTPEPYTLIFTGPLSYQPNYEAVRWFLDRVFPQVQSKCSQLKLLITGNYGDRSMPQLKNVIFTGYVEDIRPLIASASISIVPINSGGGTRLKILEAMALKTPVVTTTKGAEGLDVIHNIHALIADSPDEFADSILRLLTDDNLRNTLINNAYLLVQEKYEWSVVLPRFLNLVEITINRSLSKNSIY